MKVKNKSKNKYTIFGIGFIILIFGVVIYYLANSFALEGFGVINISCDKLTAMGGEEIKCIVSGQVSNNNQVSSLSSKINLSDDLEFVSFTTNSVWQGTGNDGDIQLYTDENKTSLFNIGEFIVKIKEGTYNKTEFISLEETYFYDEKFEEQKIEDNQVEINTPTFSSDTFDLDKEYIISPTKDISEILNLISTDNCDTSVILDNEKVKTGTISNNSKIVVSYNNVTIRDYDIIYINSSIYDLSNDYIVIDSTNTNESIKNIEVINGSINIKNNELVLSYNSVDIKNYDIVSITSDQYIINTSKDYIIIDNSISNDILENISVSDNATLSIDNDKLIIIYDNNTIKTLEIYTLYSNKYDINIIDKYIYIGNTATNETIKDNISTNASVSIDNNKLNLSNDSNTLISISLVSISSNNYTIKYDDSYIYTKTDKTLENINKNILTVNSNISINDNKIELLFNDKTIKSFDWAYITSTNKIDDTYTYIKGTTSYSDFIKAYNTNLIDIKIFNKNNTEITDIIEDGYTLNLYYKASETLLGTYKIKTEYLELSKDLSLNTDDGNIIYNILLNTTYADIKNNIDTSGIITITDSKGTTINDNKSAATGDIISIELSSQTVEYTISVKGDLTGSGSVTAGDIAKSYQYLRKKITMDKQSILAGDVTDTGTITAGDVAKLYQYLRGKINSLD